MSTTTLSNQPTFTITTQTATLRQGVLNIPAGVDAYFGEHGRIVTVTLPNEQRIHCPIDRNNTTKHGARLAHPYLKEFFGSQNQKGNQYRVKMSGTDAISIRLVEPVVEQPTAETEPTTAETEPTIESTEPNNDVQ